MTKTAFLQALQLLAETDCDAVELSCHPGESEDPDRWRYRWSYRWGEELETLVHPATRAAIDAHGFRLGTYRDLIDLAANR
jgi:predicted glycoside hydrolase/deacetylase ChbG (UPF0249 family)